MEESVGSLCEVNLIKAVSKIQSQNGFGGDVIHKIKCDKCNNRIRVSKDQTVMTREGYDKMLKFNGELIKQNTVLKAKIEAMESKESLWKRTLDHYASV